jgi:hypothetical protein
MTFAGFAIATALGLVLVGIWMKWRVAVRAEYVRSFALPTGLYDKLRAKYPTLEPKDCQLVARALRHFFLAHLKSGCKFVSMPSQVADELWHEFILHTKAYAHFCDKAFGSFLHHTPAVVLGSVGQSNAGLRRCWWHVCIEENIHPRKATRLPLLFALDAKLKIPNGFVYAVNCGAARSNVHSETTVVYCGADFSDASIDGSTEGFGSSDSDGGSSGSSCGGGGCGGGD